MIDRPNGKIERLLVQIYDHCSQLQQKAKEKTARKWIHSISAIAGVLVCGFLVVGYVTPETVTVIVDTSLEKEKTVYETTAGKVESFIEDHDIDYVDGVDDMDVELDDKIKDGMKIHITKAIDIEVTADGKTVELTTLPLTANEAIAKAGIKVGKNDIVEPAGDTMLVTGDQVVVKRVTFKKVKEEVVVDYEVVYQEDASMGIGQMELTQDGSDGLEEETYRVRYIDGKEADRELIDTKVVEEVKNKTYSYGTDISFGDAPSSYIKKVSGVRAVAYYFDGNPSGAYGLPCTYGTVAVDPDVFPLGSLLYIEGYGYAIANDVGTSIKGNVVDLYMERYDQCLMWGAHRVNVYLVERP